MVKDQHRDVQEGFMMGMLQISLAGSLLTAFGAVAMLFGSVPAMPWASQQADWLNLGIIPATSTLTPSHMV